MLQTLLVNLKLHFREKAQLFWLFAFPIILATMFNGMFGNIAESYALHTVDVVVVNNDDWRASPGAQMLVDGISSDTGATVPMAIMRRSMMTVTPCRNSSPSRKPHLWKPRIEHCLTPRRRADCPSTVVGNCSWPFPKPRKHPPRM